jgi:phosphoribosyl 1,2-cyclic phosphate phosphodiesterase
MFNKFKVTFLGTGTSQGIPVIGCTCEVCLSTDLKNKRMRTSAMLEVKGLKILIDPGPDLRYQMISNRFDNIDAILVTHEHADHTAGLDDVRPINFRYNKDIPLYALERVKKDIQQRFSYAFSENAYPGSPRISCQTLYPGVVFSIGEANVDILPIEVLHGNLPIVGFRIEDFCYITDASALSAESMAMMSGVRVLVINALQESPHFSHFTLEEALTVIEQIGPECAYLTHMSHHLGCHKDLQSKLPKSVFPAYDGMEIIV